MCVGTRSLMSWIEEKKYPANQTILELPFIAIHQIMKTEIRKWALHFRVEWSDSVNLQRA